MCWGTVLDARPRHRLYCPQEDGRAVYHTTALVISLIVMQHMI